MLRKVLFVAVLALVPAGMAWAQAVDEHTLAYWSLDEGSGGTVQDASGNDNSGSIDGATWVEGTLGNALFFDGQTNRVIVPDSDSLHPDTGDISIEAWINVASDPRGWPHAGPIVFKPNAYLWVVQHNGALWFGIWGAALRTTGLYQIDQHINEWHHAAVTFEGDSQQATIYVDGVLVNQGTVNEQVDRSTDVLYMGYKSDTDTWYHGSLDEIRISDVVRTQEEIQAFMSRKADVAVNPAPDDEAVEVLRDTVLSWTASEGAATHDVYFGTAFDDVNDAGRTNPMGVLLSQGQTETTFDPGRLEFEQAYYWRVDEVGGAGDGTIVKGYVWSFTVEPFAYTVQNVLATSNATSLAGQGAERLVDGSGLDGDGRHSIAFDDMWSGAPVEGEPIYIQFELDRVYKLYEMIVWNYNISFEIALGFGVKEATIEYSADGQDWTVLGDVELNQASGAAGYAANNAVAFDGVPVKYVRMTVNGNFSGTTSSYGLSEVRFTYTPVYAGQPVPAQGDTNVSIDAVLGWRPGREAASHEVHLGTDPNALALVGTTTNSRYGPADLDLDATHFWRIAEVNEAETVPTWTSDMWSFSTQEYIVVEDFEVYTDDTEADEAVWQTWIDGIDNPAAGGGSAVGHDPSPFAEKTTVYGGAQAMPLYYNNTLGAVHSEATRTFETPQDWTAHAIESLTLFVYGDPVNIGGRLYVKVNGTKVYHSSVSDVLQRAQWVFWPIDLAASGADLTRVASLSIGIDDAGASGLLLVDDIRLYARKATTVEPTSPSDDDPNLVAYYAFDGNADDSVGAHDATINGSPEFVAGYVDRAISFNGINESAIYTYAQETPWPACSVAFWVKPETVAQDLYCSPFNNNSSSSDFQVDVDGTNPGTYRYHGSIDMYYGVVTTEWTHLATVCDGAQTSVYYNGLHVDTGIVADTNFGRIAFGLNRASDYWFNGLMDEARLYNRPLSPAEVAALAGVTEPIVESF